MDNKLIITSKFDLGDIAVTTPLYAHCKENGYALIPYLVRHANGDWGDVCKEDWKSNDEALKKRLKVALRIQTPRWQKDLDNNRMEQKRNNSAFPRGLLKS